MERLLLKNMTERLPPINIEKKKMTAPLDNAEGGSGAVIDQTPCLQRITVLNAMEIVRDIHGNHFQIARGNEPVYSHGITVQFNSEEFAKQFIEWLDVPPDFWCHHFNIAEGLNTTNKVARLVLEREIAFVKLPVDLPLLC